MNDNNKKLSVWRISIQRNKARVATRGMANLRAKRLEKWKSLKNRRNISNHPLALKKVVHLVVLLLKPFGLEIGYDEPLTRPVDFQIERNKKSLFAVSMV